MGDYYWMDSVKKIINVATGYYDTSFQIVCYHILLNKKLKLLTILNPNVVTLLEIGERNNVHQI